jgi:hypothetical protein
MVSEFEVVGITGQSKKPFVLAFGSGNKWFLNEICNFSGKAEIKENEDYLCELKGEHMVSTNYSFYDMIKIQKSRFKKI